MVIQRFSGSAQAANPSLQPVCSFSDCDDRETLYPKDTGSWILDDGDDDRETLYLVQSENFSGQLSLQELQLASC